MNPSLYRSVLQEKEKQKCPYNEENCGDKIVFQEVFDAFIQCI